MGRATSSWFGDSSTATAPYLPLSHSSHSSSSCEASLSSSSSSGSSSGSDRANSPTYKEKTTPTTTASSSPITTSSGRPGAGSGTASINMGSFHGLTQRQRHGHRHRDSSSSDSTLVPGYSPHLWAEKGGEIIKDGVAAISSYQFNFWHLLRKLLSLTVQGALFASILGFALYGGYMFITMRWSGRYMRIPVYTKYEIGQAGWQRPVLIPSNPPNSLSHHPLAQAAKPTMTPGAVVYPPPTTNSKQQQQQGTSVQLYDFDQKAIRTDGRKNINDPHILILTPLKNAVDLLDSFFSLLTGLEHPKENISIGFLIGDEEDDTGKIVHQWVGKQQELGHYRKISLLKKDFGIITPGGDARHKNWLQGQRRSLMAKARTLLLTSTLEPSVDWVLWLDSDLAEAPKSMIADLLYYGHAGVYPDNYDNTNANLEDQMPLADVITPNIMRRLGPGQIQGYDLNNWAETPQSLKMKAKLPQDRILHEGQQNRPTHRALLARSWVPPNITSTWNDNSPYFPYMPEIEGPTDLYDPESDAYIGRTMDLDGVGGVATLVRAETHRFGAVFPSWVQDHQVETEGFGVMARQAGARIVGLQNYLVYHYFAEYGQLGI